ncbi:hypothetical protein LTS12_026723 [Elasticomyces elasticus]|nr:hypothetical protein LTS12_026723 [Elasticomyces elasticus]
MRFLQVGSQGELSLSKDVSTCPGPYAILSHTWGAEEDEVTFEDLQQGTGTSKTGYNKLRFCTIQSQRDGLQYSWVDTCCINKVNHVELSEAITSMFRWYQGATKCYVYLSDVPTGNSTVSSRTDDWTTDFRISRWFRRGWTLQELLAPTLVEFYSSERVLLGSKQTLEGLINEITEIPIDALRGTPLSQYPVEQRLQWTNGRETHKVEDKAYCLLGIFDVYMPLIYGERENAYKRLKEEIRKNNVGDRLDDEKILDWLTSVEYGPQQSNYFNRRQPGTGEWFLESAEYQTWRSSPRQTLFCPGIPGAGKTTMAAIVVDDLFAQYQNEPSFGIAYCYCSYEWKENQELDDMLLNLMKQLCRKKRVLPECVKKLYTKHAERRTRPSYEEALEVLQDVTISFQRRFLVVDAIDECPILNSCRARLLSTLRNLEAAGANVLVTSRMIPEIAATFRDKPSMEIRASPADVGAFLVNQRFRLPDFMRDDPLLLREIEAGVLQAVEGMFLLAKLHFDSLITEITPTGVRQAVRRLPTGVEAYDAAYRVAMTRILGQSQNHAKLALAIIQWITHTKRTLKASELQHALAVDPDQRAFDRGKLPPVSTMVSACAGLVIVDPSSNDMRLVHYTTDEFFRQTRAEWFPDAESAMATTCVTYLSMDSFSLGQSLSNDEFEERLRSFALYDYAARNSLLHARVVPGSGPRVLRFLQKSAHVDASAQALLASLDKVRWSDRRVYSQLPPKQVSGLHLAAHFGLEGAACELRQLKFDINARDSAQSTALIWAVKKDNYNIVKLLVEHNAALDMRDHTGRTALVWAAEECFDAVVELLVNKGAALDIEVDSRGSTALLHNKYLFKQREETKIGLLSSCLQEEPQRTYRARMPV